MAECQVDFPASLGPWTTVMRGEKVRILSLKGPKAAMETDSMRI